MNPAAITNTEDPRRALRENRLFAYGRGEQMQGNLDGRAGGSQSREDAYRDASHNAYEPLLRGYSGPGYSPEEQQAILRDQEMAGMPISQGRINDMYLGAEDQRNIMGNPYESRQFVRPDQQNAINQTGMDRQREALGGQAAGMRGAIDPSRLRLADSYGQEQNANMASGDAAVRGSINSGGIRGAVDPSRLRQDSGFADRYRMTEGNVQGYKDKAARNVAAQSQAALDDVEQRAVQDGNVSALAMGTLRSRYENDKQVNAADAMSNAELAARKEQADREMNIESNRQDAERGSAGLSLDAESNIGNLQNRSELALTQRRVDERQGREGMRIGAEQGLTDRNLEAERTIGNNRIQTEGNINRDNIDLARYQQDSGAAIWQAGDDRATDRSRAIAENGQNVGRWGEEQRFGQGMAVNNAQSNRAGAVADARRTDQGEGRNWLQNQQAQSSDNVNTANQQRLGLYGQQTGALDQNAGTTAQYDMARRNSGFGAQFKNSLANGLGNLITGGAGKAGQKQGWF